MSEKFKEWCILELMGHRRMAGLVSEQEIAGHGFLRIDVPGKDDVPGFTQLYSPSSVYAMTPVTEAVARELSASWTPEPIQRWDVSRLLPAPAQAPVIPGTPDDELEADDNGDDDGSLGHPF